MLEEKQSLLSDINSKINTLISLNQNEDLLLRELELIKLEKNNHEREYEKYISVIEDIKVTFKEDIIDINEDNAKVIVSELIKKYQSLKTVGRLDKETSGLILLTNDGDYAFEMTHPKFYKIKTYQAKLDRALEPLHQQMIADFGVELEDGKSRLSLTKLDDNRKYWQIEMSEGRNRQIRRTFAALGYRIVELHRLSFGSYKLSNLASGKYQITTKK